MMATMAENRLPMDFSDLTAEWVTSALQQRYPGVEVTGLELGKIIRGTGSKAQLLLTYNAKGAEYGLPLSMYAKGGFDWHKAAIKESYQAEARFFAEWAPDIKANIPKGYYGGWNDENGVALMEDLDLRGARYGSGAVTPLDVDTVRKVSGVLAAIHASFWEDPRLSGLRSLGFRVGSKFMFMLEPAYYASVLKEPRGAGQPKMFHDPARVRAGLEANWKQVDTGPQTFCHGDPHQGNLFFEPDGTPGYLDFQAYVRCAALHDLNYLVVGGLSPEDRRRHDRDLLDVYLDDLRALGVPDIWPREEAWDRFRRHTMHGMMWFLSPIEMQPAEVCEAHGWRFGSAAADYDLANLLSV